MTDHHTKRPRYSPDEIAFAVLRMEQGSSLSQVARDLKRDRRGLFGALRALGYPTKPAVLSREEHKIEVDDSINKLRSLSKDEIKKRILELQRRTTS